MNGVIEYLNTDLDLRSAEDLRGLAEAFEGGGVFALHVGGGDDGLWYACFETEGEHKEPESNIAAMLDVVESLSSELKAVWDACSLREFNVGYDCGDRPWAFNQGLSAELLGRISVVGASFRLTLYPDKEGRVAGEV